LWHSLRSVELRKFNSILYEMTPAIIAAPGLRRVIQRPGPLSRLFVIAAALKISCLGRSVIIQPGQNDLVGTFYVNSGQSFMKELLTRLEEEGKNRFVQSISQVCVAV